MGEAANRLHLLYDIARTAPIVIIFRNYPLERGLGSASNDFVSGHKIKQGGASMMKASIDLWAGD